MPSAKYKPTYTRELNYLARYRYVAGVDEAGVAPLAGPVVAAAVILNPRDVGRLRSRRKWWYAVRDSKMLAGRRREELVKEIFCHSFSVGIGSCSAEEIDRLNILRARLLCMKRAVENLKKIPQIILVDGNLTIPELKIPQQPVVKGDEKVLSVACASIVAKVTRDNILKTLHEKFPAYGFAQHKGYPTRQHKLMIKQFGPCEQHRKTFAPVRQSLISI